jgi:hypothetical protein
MFPLSAFTRFLWSRCFLGIAAVFRRGGCIVVVDEEATDEGAGAEDMNRTPIEV